MFDLKVRTENELASVPVPLPGRVMVFAGENGLMTRKPDGTLGAAAAQGAASPGSAILRGVVQAIDPNLSGERQVFGGIDLASVGAHVALIEVIAPLLARLDPSNALSGCEIDLFVRVNGGNWVWWDAYELTNTALGEWVTVQITARFVVDDGHLCSLTNSTARLPFTGAIEWSAKLQYPVAEARPIAALVMVS